MSEDVITPFTVYGIIASPAFQQCTEAAAYVNRTYTESFAVTIQHEVPRDFEERRAQWVAACQLPPEHQHCDVLVHNVSTNALMTAEEFIAEIMKSTHYRPDPSAAVASNHDSYSARAQQSWLDFLASRDRQYCWMDVTIDDAPVGRIWFELYSNMAPLTCKNFCELCRGTSVEVAPPSASTNGAAADHAAGTCEQLSYKGTTFFRILKDAWVMAGDVTAEHSGTGGYSCFGRTFPDETFAVAHDAVGVLGMCNDGPHTNASSFYITRRPLSWMNRKYVAFGRVMDGLAVVDAIHAVDVKHNQSPLKKIVIADCGVLDPSE
ncbi:cyclophilin 12 putative (CYP12) [Leptomonas seymouri]|uniref:Cyclophilin 12 putative (CYP12) n=1 Tax=Leptomonas seymouri TaxID=5684 RepID=A0A0N1IL84_LEPSE|nr:cyclophilin 12 putative (CYP12) [Leptomonas seymouri]|eukprot:KPI87840.1 cyclophilin 12 putative (CYP12) [Leptomonas seymouri]